MERPEWAEALGVCGKKIVFVGALDEAMRHIDDRTQLIDLENRMLMPGFVDAHSHPVYLTNNLHSPDLKNCQNMEECQKLLKSHSEAYPDSSIIIGINFMHHIFDSQGPRKEIIDEVIDHKPVVIYAPDGHSLWVNSKTLEVCGINEKTECPKGGEFVKDSQGALTGFINAFPALNYVMARLPEFTTEEYAEGLLDYITKAQKSGITFVHDSDINSHRFYEAYQILNERGALTLRARLAASIYPDLDEPVERQYAKIIQYHKNPIGDLLRTDCLKIMLDGVVYTHTAALNEPYRDEPDLYGDIQWDTGIMRDVCRKAYCDNLQIEIHCIGDKASDTSLTILEEVSRANGANDSRPILNHLQVISPETPKRMGKLGAVAVLNPQWIEKDYYYERAVKSLGNERGNALHPFKKFIDAGVMVAAGSDVPVEHREKPVEIYFAPLVAIQQGVTRCAIDEDCTRAENVLGSDEKVSLKEILKVFTINGAYANFAENITGSLAPGKYADMIILEKNLFDVPVDALYNVKILETIFEGKTVYRQEPF